MNNSQMLKGILSGVVLHVISEGPIYGYELVTRLRKLGFTDITGGTVYPIVQKMEKAGQLTSKQLPSPDGPNRKYLFVSPAGEAFLAEFDQEWAALAGIVNNIIK